MQTMLKKLFCLTILFCSVITHATNKVAPLMSPRSGSVDSALELAGWTNHVNLYDMEGFYGTFAITPQYTRSFRENSTILPCLFGNDIDCSCPCPKLTISGRCVANRGTHDWLADYFGLPQDFKSEVTFTPHMDTVSFDFNMYIGLNPWWEGLYFRAHAPLEHARYRLGYRETVIGTTSSEQQMLGIANIQAHEEGYFSNAYVPRANLLNKFEDFIADCKVPTLSGQESDQDTTAVSSNVVFNKLNCAKISTCKKLTETKVSDIQCALGWNILQDKNFHLGVEIRGSIPTGTRPEGRFLFEPIVGNGRHWELGGGITGHMMLWQREDEQSHLGVWIDANVTHMFKARQKRFFDLCNQGGNSRYMLAMKLDSDVTNLFGNLQAGDVAGSIAPSAQFANEFTPVANLTCCDVDVSIGVQGDVTAMVNYTIYGISCDVGYNFWGRSCEKIKLNCTCPCPLEKEPKSWALKGDSSVYGFVDGTQQNGAQDTPVALSGTQTTAGKANIHAGANVPVRTRCSDATSLNPGVENARFARSTEGATGTGSNINNLRSTSTTYTAAQTQTSVNPLFLTVDDMDLRSARTKGLSHKFFAHISYTWEKINRFTPYAGVGVKVELSPEKSCCIDTSDDTISTSCRSGSCGSCDICCSKSNNSCMKCNFSQWGIWVKGGISFD